MPAPLARYPTRSLSQGAQLYCYALVGVFMVMVTAQLMTFEKFIPILQNYQIGSTGAGKVMAGIIVAAEVLALPFLLRLRLSRLMRWLSAALLKTTGMIWFGLGVWALLTHPPLIGSGLTGSLLSHLPPLVSATFAALLCVATLGAVYMLRHDLKPTPINQKY